MPWNDNVRPGPWGPPPGDERPDARPADGSAVPEDGPASPGDDAGAPSPWGASPPARPEEPARPGPPGRNPLGGPRRPRAPKAPRPGPGLEALSERWRERARRFFRHPSGRGLRPGALAVVAGAALGLWALSGVYIVQPNEQAVVTRFGAYTRSEAPGLKVRLPWPIEAAETVPVTTLRRVDVGGEGAADAEESLMLTGDENIVDMDFTVNWRVSDPDDYLFRVSNPEATVKAVAESAMREVVGRTQLDAVLSTGRGRLQLQAEQLMQRVLDSYRAGIDVESVQIRAANPPQQVIAAFREVASAGQEAESAINEANTFRNKVVNEAVGTAAGLRQTAEGYRLSVVSEAEGEAARFNQIQAQYAQAPGVTRERLYLETMERVLARSNKIVVDGQSATAPIVLPPEAFRPRAGAAGPPQPAPQAAPQASQQSASPAPSVRGGSR